MFEGNVAVGKDEKGRRFSIFRSADEEAQMHTRDHRRQEGEGGHMSYVRGRIVSLPGEVIPFKAVMTLEDGSTHEVAFSTMAEAEAHIRRNTPDPAVRSTTYDHDQA